MTKTDKKQLLNTEKANVKYWSRKIVKYWQMQLSNTNIIEIDTKQ